MQLAVVEFARNVCKLKDANTTEVNPQTPYPVIDLLPEQKAISTMSGTLRLGAYAALLKPSTKIYELYQKTHRLESDQRQLKEMQEQHRLGETPLANAVIERHRHRYEQNPQFINILEQNGLIFSGYHQRADETQLMEFIELQHSFFIATQAHPEFKSRLQDPSPLFYGFIEAAKKKSLPS